MHIVIAFVVTTMVSFWAGLTGSALSVAEYFALLLAIIALFEIHDLVRALNRIANIQHRVHQR